MWYEKNNNQTVNNLKFVVVGCCCHCLEVSFAADTLIFAHFDIIIWRFIPFIFWFVWASFTFAIVLHIYYGYIIIFLLATNEQIMRKRRKFYLINDSSWNISFYVLLLNFPICVVSYPDHPVILGYVDSLNHYLSSRSSSNPFPGHNKCLLAYIDR